MLGYKLLDHKVLRSMGRKRKINMIYDLEVMQLLGNTIMKNDSAENGEKKCYRTRRLSGGRELLWEKRLDKGPSRKLPP